MRALLSLFSFKNVMSFLLVLVSLSFIQSDEVKPAQVLVNTESGKISTVVFGASPLLMTVDVSPNSWSEKNVELRILSDFSNVSGSLAQKYFDGTTWHKYESMETIPPISQFILGPINNFKFKLLENASEAQTSSTSIMFCLTLEGSSFNPYDINNTACDRGNYSINALKILSNPNPVAAIKAASLQLITGQSFGAAELKTVTEKEEFAYFDVTLPNDYQSAALYLSADDNMAAFTNKLLDGVKVTITELNERRGTEGSKYATYQAQNLKVNSMSRDPYSIQNSAQLQSAVKGWIKNTTGKTKFNKAEAMKLIESAPNFLTQTHPDDLSALMQANQMFYMGLMQAFNIAVPFKKNNNTPAGFMIIRPMATSYRIKISAKAATQPFRLYAGLIPVDYSGADYLQASYAYRVTRFQRLNMHAQSQLAELLAGSQTVRVVPAKLGALPFKAAPELPLPKFCKDLTESDAAKLWSTIAAGAINGGAVLSAAKLIGLPMVGAGKLTQEVLQGRADALGWAAGALGDISDWVDVEKQLLRAYTVNAFLPFVDEIQTKILNEKNFCLYPRSSEQHSDLDIELRLINPCGKQLWGVAPEGENAYLTNKFVGDLSFKGPASGNAVYGTGAIYHFQAVMEGSTELVIEVPLLDRIEKVRIPITVKKCASPQRKPPTQ